MCQCRIFKQFPLSFGVAWRTSRPRRILRHRPIHRSEKQSRKRVSPIRPPPNSPSYVREGKPERECPFLVRLQSRLFPAGGAQPRKTVSPTLRPYSGIPDLRAEGMKKSVPDSPYLRPGAVAVEMQNSVPYSPLLSQWKCKTVSPTLAKQCPLLSGGCPRLSERRRISPVRRSASGRCRKPVWPSSRPAAVRSDRTSCPGSWRRRAEQNVRNE